MHTTADNEITFDFGRCQGDGTELVLTMIPKGSFIDPKFEDELRFMPMPEPPVFEAIEVGTLAAGLEEVGEITLGEAGAARGLVTQDEIDAAAAEAEQMRAAHQVRRASFEERLGVLMGQAWHNGKRLA